jgi:hypothetical protein
LKHQNGKTSPYAAHHHPPSSFLPSFSCRHVVRDADGGRY